MRFNICTDIIVPYKTNNVDFWKVAKTTAIAGKEQSIGTTYCPVADITDKLILNWVIPY